MVESSKDESYTLKLDEQTDKYVSVYLYKNVQNIEELHKKVISKELPCCIVNAKLILDPFQIAIATNKAVLNEKYQQMITRNLYTEVIYCLSISKNISQSLSLFGISNDVTNIVVILVYNVQERESLEKLVSKTIVGEQIPITSLYQYSDINLIKRTYKINELELQVSSLLNSIVSRISDKISK